MRATVRLLTAALAGVLAAGLGVLVVALASPAAAAGAQPTQVITVQAAAPSSTTARVDLWQRSPMGGYLHVGGPVTGHIGAAGVGAAREGFPRTPAGVFTLTQAFGNQPNNGTLLPYFQAGPSDWWNGESGSHAYNTHVHQSASPGPASENLYRVGAVYAHAVVIDYNRFPAHPGAGSAFFLHVTNSQPTEGCVAVPAGTLNTIMRWLKPSAHPVISIGVGAQATALITRTNAAAALHNPRGYLDSATSGQGTVRAVGWAADPDLLTGKLLIDVYLDGRMRGQFGTGVHRPDVAAAIHAGPNQGYDATVTGVAAGRHTVCVYALNIKYGTSNTRFKCALVTTR